MATIDDTLLMDIKHAVDDAAALEAAADPADTTEDETAVGDEARLSGIHEINGDGPVDGYSPYKPTVLDSPHKLFKQSSLRDWLQATKPLKARAVSLQGSANEPEQRAHGDPDGLDGYAHAMAAETGVGQGESLPHASANEPEHRAHAEPNGLEGNASVTAGTEAGIASGFSDAPPETSTEAPPTGRPPDDAAAGALSAGAIKLESTGCPPDDAAAGALSAGAINDEETAGGITALAPAGAGAGAARELGVSTPIGPLAATVLSRRALLLPATRATPPAPAQLHSSSCAFPASSMSPGGVCEISSDEIAFAGDTLECGFASNSYDSPGRGGADGTGAKKPNYVPDKANQDQKPGGFSLATGCPPGDTAAGALSTGKLESGRGGAAAGAISAGAPKLECTGRPPGGAAAGALSAGAIKLESTGRPPDDAAAGALSAGAIKIESERGLLGPAAASALSAGTITKLEREVVREEAGVVARARTVGKGAEALGHGGGGGAADAAAGAEGEAIENVEVQPGLASDAPGYGGADKDDSPSRGGVDAAGLEEHSSDSSNEEPGYGAGRPRGDAAAGALSAGAIKLESTGRPPDDAAAGALSAGAIKSNASVTAGTEAGIASGFSDAPPETSAEAPPTGRPPDDAAAGALSAGAIKIESERGLLGPAAASALSAGTITKLESTGRPPNNAAADTLSAGANKPESKRGRLGHAAADELLMGRPPGNAAAGALPVSATKLKITGRPPGGAAAGALSTCVTKLKGTHHSISDVALTRSRPAPTRSRARAARSAMRPPTRAEPTEHKFSGDTSTNHARRAKSIERRAAAKNTAGAC